MSTIDDKLLELIQIKDRIRQAINDAYGEEIVDEGECFSAYADIILSNLCKCQKLVEYWTVSFDTKGGTDVADRTVPKGTSISTSPTTIKEGYEFIGWTDEDDNYISFPYTPTNNVTLKAKWNKKTYKITTVSSPTNGGSALINGSVTSDTFEYGDIITISAEPNDNYKFINWSDNGAQSHEITVTGNTNYTAYFDQKQSEQTYTLSVNYGAGVAGIEITEKE